MNVLKHKPGLVSKNVNLGQIMAQDTAVDPLIGNYTLLQQSGIAAAFQGANNQLTVTAFTTQPNGSSVAVQKTASIQLADQNPGKQVAVASADFNGDSKAELALLYVQDDAQLYLQMAVYTDTETTGITIQGEAIFLGSCSSEIVKANVDYIDNKLSLILTWSDGQNQSQFWFATFDNNLSPLNPVTSQGPLLTTDNRLEVDTGVITGTNNGELVLFYQGTANDQGNDLFIGLYNCTASGITLLNQIAVGKLGNNAPVISLVTGAFLAATVQDGIVIAWTDDTKTNLQTFEANMANTGNQITLVPVCLYATIPTGTSDVPAIRMACGDLNNDGVEELVIGTTASTGQIPSFLHLQVYNFTNTLNPQLQSEAFMYGDNTYKFIAFDFKLEIANFLENNTGSGIVVGALGADNSLLPLEGYARVSIGVLQVDPDLKFPVIYQNSQNPAQFPGLYSSEDAFDSSKVMNLNLALNIGDFSGNSVRVGTPVYQFIEDCSNVLAVINMLPTQAAINNSGQVTFNDMSSTETSMGLKTTRNHTTSNTLDTSLGMNLIGDINHSISNTYGDNFSKSFEQFSEITQNLNVLTNQDDFLLLAVNDFETWEYPVYNDADNTIQGHILVIFPTSNVKQRLTIPGLNLSSYYRPRHLLGNILSYSALPPVDYDENSGSYCNQSMQTGNIQITADANWTNSNTQSISHESSQDQNIGTSVSLSGTIDFLGGFSVGLDYKFQDDYSQSTTSNYEVEYMQSTNISMVLMPLDTDVTTVYTVVPYVYWSTAGNYLKLDYQVTIPNGSIYYQDHYTEPNPTFHLCWASQAGNLAKYTRDLNFAPSNNVLGTVDIQVTVHNDTLGTQGVTSVAVYNGDPFNGGTQIGSTQMISSIGPRDFVIININDIWQPTTDTDYLIYAVIDPDITLDKATTTTATDKIGFGYYPVTNIISMYS